MSRSTRIFELVQLLGTSREYTTLELAERFAVTRRTIFRDLAELRRRKIPVVCGDYGHRLLEGSLLRPLNLSGAERGILRLALENSAVRAAPGSDAHWHGLVAKLDAVTHFAEEEKELQLAGPERGGAIKEVVFRNLERACKERLTIEFEYASLSSPSRLSRAVDPYQMFHREGAWYLVGRCHRSVEVRIFRLDRIATACVTEKVFRLEEFDLSSYLADSWTVYRGASEHDIELCIEPDLAPLFRHGMLHSGETIREEADGRIRYRVRLTHLEEIARFICGFGRRVRVVGPKELQRRVCELAREVLGNYSGGG